MSDPSTPPTLVPATDEFPKEIPDIYFNAHEIRLGTGDIYIVLHRRDNIVGVLEMSYTVAKTLAQELTNVVTILEQATGTTIMTSRFVEEKIDELTKIVRKKEEAE